MVDFKYIPFTVDVNGEQAYCIFGIQLQGNRFKYVLEFLGNFGSNKKLAKEIIYKCGFEFLENKKWLASASDILGESKNRLFSNKAILGHSNKNNEFDKNKVFCSYGDTFIYKYDSVNSNITVAQLVELYADFYDYLVKNQKTFKELIEKNIAIIIKKNN